MPRHPYPEQMPVILVGADTPHGRAILPLLAPQSGEIRCFVSDPTTADELRSVGKIAVGDISDGTHVGGAAIGAFCAVLVAATAHDDRERHFAASPAALFTQWADGLKEAEIGRIILVADQDDATMSGPLAAAAPEFVVVPGDQPLDDVAAQVARLEQAQKIS